MSTFISVGANRAAILLSAASLGRGEAPADFLAEAEADGFAAGAAGFWALAITLHNRQKSRILRILINFLVKKDKPAAAVYETRAMLWNQSCYPSRD